MSEATKQKDSPPPPAATAPSNSADATAPSPKPEEKRKTPLVAARKPAAGKTPTVATEQEDLLEKHIKEFALEPLDSSLDVQALYRTIQPDLSGFFEIIEEAKRRLHASFGYLNRPGQTSRDDTTTAWLDCMDWACLREFLLFTEKHESLLQAPRAKMNHNHLLIPADVSYAIQHMRPLVGKDGPTVAVSYDYAKSCVLANFPSFLIDDRVKLEQHQSCVTFLQSRRLTTLNSVNHEWKTSLLASAVVEDKSLRAYVSREKLSSTQMLFVLRLALFKARAVNGITFVPVLRGVNSVMAPYLTTHRRGDFYDYELQWSERVSHPLALQFKM